MNRLQEYALAQRAVESLPKRPRIPNTEEQMHADVQAWRTYQAARRENPFAAARFHNDNRSAIARGRALDTYTDEPPPEPDAA